MSVSDILGLTYTRVPRRTSRRRVASNGNSHYKIIRIHYTLMWRIDATDGKCNDSRLSAASSEIDLFSKRHRYRSTTTEVLWILCLVHQLKGISKQKKPRYRRFTYCPAVVIPLQWCHNGRDTSQITSLTMVYSTVYSGADKKKKHESSVSLAFVRGIHRGTVNSPHKGPVTRKMFPFDDVIMQMRN